MLYFFSYAMLKFVYDIGSVFKAMDGGWKYDGGERKRDRDPDWRPTLIRTSLKTNEISWSWSANNVREFTHKKIDVKVWVSFLDDFDWGPEPNLNIFGNLNNGRSRAQFSHTPFMLWNGHSMEIFSTRRRVSTDQPSCNACAA